MILVSGIVCVYYNVIMAWSLYYMYIAFSSFRTGVLPWTTCDNEWNTPACLVRANSGNGTSHMEANGVNSTLRKYTMEAGNLTTNATEKTITSTTEFWE